MRRTFAALAFTGVLASAAASLLVLPNAGEVQAAPSTATFVVPAHDGYGIAECLASNTECAKVVADSWCESQGFLRAESFGLAKAEDVTGSIQLASVSSHDRPFTVTCTN
jgi:hypothetical protein